MKFSSLALFAASACTTLAATPQQWRNKSIYFVMTDRFARTDGSTTAPCDVTARQYCGGTWRGLINKLDYIKGMGFGGVWITPVTHNIENNTEYGVGFHGYWQDDIYKLNEHYGPEGDLKALAQALHSKGMYLMVDVVANHFAWDGTPDSVNYKSYTPFNDKKYFHSPCPITNYDNQTNVEDCWLAYDSAVPLPDVNTELQVVKDTYYNWIKNLVQKYSIDGLRVDTVKHVQKNFWPGFNKASGVYNVGEVFQGDPNYVCPYQEVMDGILNYPLFFPLTRAFQASTGSMSDLAAEVNQIKTTCKDSTLLGTFLENHDNPRFPSLTPDFSLAKNAIAFTLMSDGIPIIYYGQEQHFNGASDPYDREALWLSKYNTKAPLYTHIANLNKIRSWAIQVDSRWATYKANVVYTDTHSIALRKGYDGDQIVSVYSNVGATGGSYNATIPNTGYKAGQQVTDVLSCKKIKADSKGSLQVTLTQGLPQVYFPTDKLKGSGLCSSQWGSY